MCIFNRHKKISIPSVDAPKEPTPVKVETPVISSNDEYILSLAKHQRTQDVVNRNLIILNAHFIEKEMAVNNTDTASFKFLEPISKALIYLLNNKYKSDDFALLLATKLLLEYDKEDTLNVQNQIPDYLKEECKDIKVGRIEPELLEYRKQNIEFLRTRHSYRRFKPILVPEETILSIINTAANTPTACNRQPCRVIYSTTEEGNNKIRNVVPDKFVSKTIPNFFIIAVDKSMFNPGEELQEFVNGGIFLESLLLSIHAHGLGATAFQTSIFVSKNIETLKNVGLKENEIIIATIGFGFPESELKIAAAHKRKANEFSRKI